MIDLKLNNDWDLDISSTGDISPTESVVQAVKIRLLWFLHEWRLGPEAGFPYFEDVFVKHPSEAKIKNDIRETILSVKEVTQVHKIEISIDKKTREAKIHFVFSVGEETFDEEVKLKWNSMD